MPKAKRRIYKLPFIIADSQYIRQAYRNGAEGRFRRFKKWEADSLGTILRTSWKKHSNSVGDSQERTEPHRLWSNVSKNWKKIRFEKRCFDIRDNFSKFTLLKTRKVLFRAIPVERASVKYYISMCITCCLYV